MCFNFPHERVADQSILTHFCCKKTKQNKTRKLSDDILALATQARWGTRGVERATGQQMARGTNLLHAMQEGKWDQPGSETIE